MVEDSEQVGAPVADSSGAGPRVAPPGPGLVPQLVKATITLEDAGGVVATIVCEPDQSFGAPRGHPRLRIGREETDPHRLAWAVDRRILETGDPVVEIVAGRVTITVAPR